jgi:hypothetical protein
MSTRMDVRAFVRAAEAAAPAALVRSIGGLLLLISP